MLNILYIFSQQHQTCISTSYTNQQISFPSHYTILWYIHFTDYKKSKDGHVSYSIISRQAQKKPTNSFTMLVRRSNNLEKAHTKATAQYPWSRETFGRHQRPSKRARSDPASPTDCTIEEHPPKKNKNKNRISISKNDANYERWESERRGNRDLKVVKEKEYGLSLIVANRSDGEVWEGREDDDPLPGKKERSELRAFVMRMGPNHVRLTPAVFFFFL